MSQPGSSPPPPLPPGDGGSSPLFFSSSPQKPREDEELTNRTERMSIQNDGMSSPLNYSSSPPPPSSQHRARGSSSRLRSDVENDERRRNNARNKRGDIFSNDSGSTPRRQLVQDVVMSDANRDLSAGDMEILDETGAGEGDDESNNADNRVLWGTNISVNQSHTTFKTFLKSFKIKYRHRLDEDENVEGVDGDKLVYVEMMNQMMELGLTNLNLDMKNLLAYPLTKKLYYQLINYPQDLIPILDMALTEVLSELYSQNNREFDDSFGYRVRPYGILEKRNMRDLNPGDIDKLCSIKGLVIRSTPVIPDMKQAFFKCSVCNHAVEVPIDRGVIAEPTRCPREQCNQQNAMQLVHNRSDFSDKQVVRLQETPDYTPDGQTPHSVSLCSYDELVDICKAGDRVEVTGVFRSVPVRIHPRQRTLKNLFKTYIDVVHIQKVDKKRMGVDVSTLGPDLQSQMNDEQQKQQDVEETRQISEEEIAKIEATGAREDVYELLSRSLAPSIYEQDDVKKGILLQLFGGANKTFEKGGSPRYRGDINVLLCGDPSTSKSQLLQYVHKIAPRGIYTSGKGSSAVGLTAYVTRDLETKQLVLESGALVLSDGGVCCIDEFDKMSDSTRSVLHEVMEQQTVSVAKAGIITTLNARTSVLASANPIGSKYDTTMSVPQNIDLPPTLLSRFDLVYLMIDKIDQDSDRRLATHLASMYTEDRPERANEHEVLPVEFLTLYISYAKQHIHPRLSAPAKDELVKAYVAMRKLGEDARSSEKRITATTRQLESMIRLSEAHAKMRLSHEVAADDVLEAVRLIRSAIKEYAMDPLTGAIDMDLVQTGTSSAQRRQRDELSKHVVKLLDALDDDQSHMRYDELLRRVNDTQEDHVENNELGQCLRDLENEGMVVQQGTGQRRTIRRQRAV